MSAIVLELQKDALDRQIPISDLLRKALLVAKKLNIFEFEQWVNNELNGYENPEGIPSYRHVIGTPKYFNPYNGWQPIVFEDTGMAEGISKRASWQGIAEIESLLANTTGRSGPLQIPFPTDIQTYIAHALGIPVQSALIISSTALVRITDAVRTIILNWSIKLESDGILGEELSFTVKERQVAEKTSYNINNFYGSVQNPQIQQETTESSQVMNVQQADLPTIRTFLVSLQSQIEELRLSHESRRELDSDIETALAQVESPKPKHGIIRESLSSIRRILEGAGGGLAANLLMECGRLLMG